MNDAEITTEVEARFEQKGMPSRWIKLFRNLSVKIQHELTDKVVLGPNEIPIFGGAWWEASKKCRAIIRKRVWLLVTSQFVYWHDGQSFTKISPVSLSKIEPESQLNAHFAARGFFGLRRFSLTMIDGTKKEMPSKGGGAAVSVWSALGLLCARQKLSHIPPNPP